MLMNAHGAIIIKFVLMLFLVLILKLILLILIMNYDDQYEIPHHFTYTAFNFKIIAK